MKYVVMLGFLFIGLSFVGFGSFALLDHNRKERECTEQVVATVTDIEHEVLRSSGKKSRDEHYYSPVLTYTVNGVVYDMTSHISDSSSAAFPVGTKVAIRYNPDNPKDFYEEDREVANTYVIFIAIGAGILLAAALLLWRSSRRMRLS